MENQKVYKTPSKTLARMQVVHLGKILFNLQFVAVAVMLASVLSFLMPAIYFLVLILITLLTLGMAFANPAFSSYWTGGEYLTHIAEVFAQSWQYTVPIVAVLAVLSIVCLCFDKTQKHTARITVSAIMCVLAVVVLVAKLINNGGM